MIKTQAVQELQKKPKWKIAAVAAIVGGIAAGFASFIGVEIPPEMKAAAINFLVAFI